MKDFISNWLLVGVLCLLTVASVMLFWQYKTPVPAGVWKDVDSDYFIVFFDDGSYTETAYNLSRPYEVAGDRLTLYDISGQQTTTQLTRNYGGKITVNLNGHVRIMAPTSRAPSLYQWEDSELSQPIAAYKLHNSFDKTYYLRLYPNEFFTSVLGNKEVRGKYALASTGELLLFTRGGNSLECLMPCSHGYAVGRMTTDIDEQVIKSNPLEERGLLLSGFASDISTGARYIFTEDNSVIREDASGLSTEFIYFVDPTGFVTLTDTAGLGIEDYLYFDTVNNVMYRYVLQRDGWVDYLVSAGQQGGYNEN